MRLRKDTLSGHVDIVVEPVLQTVILDPDQL